MQTKKSTRFLSLILTICLLIGSTATCFSASATQKNKNTFVGTNGTTYEVISGNNSATIINNSTKDETIITLNGDKLTTQTKKYTGTKFISKTEVLNVNNLAINNYNNLMGTRSISYQKKTKERYKQRYWYQYGYTSKTSYLRIGCESTYLLNLTKMSASKRSHCNKYPNYVLACNKAHAKARAAFNANGLSTTLLITVTTAVLATGGAALPVAAVVSAVIAIAGGSAASLTAGVKYMIDSKDYYEKSKNTYDQIKTYGKKL